ncbi:MAG TPA: extracellular solute-binding protein, partial [Thermomicrobiales bacterium]|nr:extracellular solute-binding protein [Thermomicrobiales bacterium]
MSEQRIQQLLREAQVRGYTRRQFMERAGALGLSVPALSVALSKTAAAQGDTENPLGVDPSAPLDVVIFKGGYGDEYAQYVNNEMYAKLYPDAEITYAGIQRLGEQLQPRFVAGNPPDVIDNSGAGNLDTAALVAEGQLADLTDLLNAPSYDIEGKTVGETFVQGTQETGKFDEQQLYLNLVLVVTGLWYSSTFMEERGYTYPKTWPEMMDLSAEIKGSGMSPWATTGVYPQYMKNFVFDQMLWKHNPQA